MQLALYERDPKAGSLARSARGGTAPATERTETRLCAACRAREARYGFRDREDDDPTVDRPNTLCFDCFRMEMDRRRAVAEQTRARMERHTGRAAACGDARRR